MDQFQCSRLVHGVCVGPVDTDLEGFLDGGKPEGIQGVLCVSISQASKQFPLFDRVSLYQTVLAIVL